jgi:hypothetical protein
VRRFEHEKINMDTQNNNYNYRCRVLIKKSTGAGCQWLTPVILATQEAEIRRITV